MPDLPADGSPHAPPTFSSRQSIAPMMWAFFGIAMIELVVVHALLANWYPTVAAILFVGTLATIIWLGVGIRSLTTQPSMIDGDQLIIRAGRFASHSIDLSTIDRVAGEPSSDAINAPGVSNIAMIAHPNVIVHLSAPQTRRVLGRDRPVRAVAHRFDDPGAFLAAVTARLVQKSPENMEFSSATSL